MKVFKFYLKFILQVLFVIIFFSTSSARSLDNFEKGELISDYFSGTLLLNDNRYEDSLKYFKNLKGLEIYHKNYSLKYLYSLINSGKFKEAFSYSRKLESKKLDSFESHLISGIFYIKNSNFDLAKKHFRKAKNKNSRFILNNYVSNSLYNWSNLTSLSQAELDLKKIQKGFENLKKIQNVFLNCYYNSPNTIKLFKAITSDTKTDFSRYNYFYASYLVSIGQIKNASEVVNSALKIYPRNLLLNQYKKDLKENKNISLFNCKKKEHVIAEILYIAANAISSQSAYSLSNFYLNLAKYLNEDFHSYDTLLAENFYKIENFIKAKKIYTSIGKNGEAFNWYAAKQIARILIKEGNKKKAFKLLSNSYNELINKNIYEIFDYAELLKNNEKFKEAIPYYTKIINQIDEKHILYSEVADGRGVSYERIGEWKKAEKDLIDSLRASPDQAYVINYLAYSWIEQGINIEKSLKMLEKANKIKSNDPFITDSLGWALFQLKRYKDAESYLQLAVRLLPADPVVNDHYGDVLWKNGNEIQARYYWNYVLSLEKTENELKKKIKEKLIKGI